MGSAKRVRPKRLGEKLLAIRNHFDCSLTQMSERLSSNEIKVSRTVISAYELNDREPPLPVLLAYARLANIYVEILIDDRLDLSERIPAPKKLPV